MFTLNGSNEYAVYLDCPVLRGSGFHRNYFDGKHAFGKICLETMKLQLISAANGPKAKGLFEARVIQDNWLACNDKSQDYYEDNRQKIEAAVGMIKNPSDLEFQEKGTFKELKHDFSMRYFKGEIDSTQSYFKLLQEKGAYRLFFDAVERSDDFDKMAEHLDDFMQSVAELPDIKADID